MNTADLDDYRWLTSIDAEPWLTAAPAAGKSLAAQLTQLRSELSPVRAHLVLEQLELREKARAKFSAAAQMFFAARALEQATDEIVGRYKASRFAAGSTVFDLCCGIGGDLLPLADRGPAVGYDLDGVLCLLAAANLRVVIGAADAASSVVQSDVEALDMSQCVAWHIDPDRRPGGRRTTQVALYQPDNAAIDRLLDVNGSAAIKLAPAAEPPPHWSERAELEWISRARQCRQLVAWFGNLTGEPGQRCATVLRGSEQAPRRVVGTPGMYVPAAERIAEYLFEPDAAVLAAQLEGSLAAEHALEAIAPGAVYFTGPNAIHDAALDCFAVREVMPYRIKPLKSLLRARGIGTLEIKKRGVDVDPGELRKQLALSGDEQATLIIARIDKRVVAILADRVSASEADTATS